MKLSTILCEVSLIAYTYGSGCPYALMRREGLLDEESAAKLDAIRRDANAAEGPLDIHRRETGASSKAEPGLVGPRKRDGGLDLPLGGGLCRSRRYDKSTQRRD